MADPLPPLSLTLKVAVRVPVAVGVKVMVRLQLFNGCRLLPQPLEATLKSEAFAPVIVMPVIFSARRN